MDALTKFIQELAKDPLIAALSTIGGAVALVLLVLGWMFNFFGLRTRIQARLTRKPYPRQDVTAFDVIGRAGELLPRLYGTPPPGTLGDLDMPYTPRREGRDLQAELRQRLNQRGKLLITGASGLGKTREAGMLVESLLLEGFTAILMRTEGWLDVPTGYPKDLPNNRLVIVLDDLHRLLPAPAAAQTERDTRDPAIKLPSYEERLARFVRHFEQSATQVRVVATAKSGVDPVSGADEWAALRARMTDRLWDEFERFELDSLSDAAKVQLLQATAQAANVPAEDDALQRCAQASDSNPCAIKVNVLRCQQTGEPLRPERYTSTLYGSWEERYRLVTERDPIAAKLYCAMHLLQQADVALEVSLVEETARLLCGNRLRRALAWPRLLKIWSPGKRRESFRRRFGRCVGRAAWREITLCAINSGARPLRP